jgi:hypothetical protein
MSVGDPRLAAAQRTAARKSNLRRARLCATWLFIVPLLGLFSFSVVAGASTFGREDLGGAIEQLPDQTHVIEVPAALSQSRHYVCSVNTTQLARIQTRYRTGRITVGSLDVVTVYNANEQVLRGYLGDVTCVLVHVSHTFFLPFDAHTS